MFISAKVQNAEGDELELMTQEALAKFVLSNVQGLNPPPATLNMNNLAGVDGARLNSAFLNTRNLVITFLLRGDQESSRQELYHYFRTKSLCRFYFKNTNRDVFIDGYVETIEDDMFQRQQEMQVSVICPDPWLQDVVEHTVEIQNAQAHFTFPFAINLDDPVPVGTYEQGRVTHLQNYGDTDLGIQMFIGCDSTLFKPKIMNMATGEYINITFTPQVGDVLYINTDPLDTKALYIRAGVQYNLWPYIGDGATLFQLHPGDNPIGYQANGGSNDDDGRIIFRYRQKYRGV